jgi:multicomponent Na+:H+ antiporter subunit A
MSARPVQPRALVIRVVFTALAAGLTALFARFAPAAAGGEVWTWSAPYVASLDLTLALRLDALSVVFACLATGVGAVVFAYAASYQTERTAAFYVYLACFMFAMLGVVLADDLILLYGSWELTSIASFFLIGFDHEEKEEARRGAQHALLVTVLGGLCLLAGLILIGVAADTTRLSVLLTQIGRASCKERV